MVGPIGRRSGVGALMRAGRLAEATAEIQRSLGAGGLPGLTGFTAPTTLTRMRPFPGARSPDTAIRGSFTGPAGTIGYRLVVPSRAQSPAPLLVMLHGGTQDATSFAAATGMDEAAEREGFLVVYPEQSRAANAMGYWNWFRPGDQRRDAGEPSLVAGVIRAVTAERDVDPARVGVAGFSAGGAMAAVMAATYPDLLAGAGVHSGLAHRAAHDVGSAYAAMGGAAPSTRTPSDRAAEGVVPLLVVHGDADATVAPRNAEAVLAAAPPSALAPEVTTGRVPGGRAWTRQRRRAPDGRLLAESWTVHGGGHAWSGGRAGASYTDPAGPDTGAALVAFLDLHRR